jgi:hypothetical protein
MVNGIDSIRLQIKKVMLPLYLTNYHYAMKVYGGVMYRATFS